MQGDTSRDVKTTTPPAIDLKRGKYVGEGYEVEFRVTSKWEGTFGGELKLTNTSDKPLENWTLKFDLEHEIKNMWNAKIATHEGNSYIIKNADWNQDLAPGSSINIGFEASWDKEIKVPQNYDLLVTKQDVSKEDYTIEFKVTSDWGQAFNGEISITNNTKETIEDWSLEFDFDRNIKSFWEAKIGEHKDNHYVIKNMGYNANIAPGQTIRLGFGGDPGNVTNKPSNYKLNQIGQEIDYEKDSDGDGLPDWFEKGLGTDPNKVDTDSDGLPDGYEYFVLRTSPLKADTDDNGVCDGDEDFDNDTLVNIDEYENKTEPLIEDTDEDGLKDGEDVHVYGTDPLKADTDGDGLNDLDDILLGFDPLLYDTYQDGICDGDRKIKQISELAVESHDGIVTGLSVEMNTAGYLKHNLEINNMFNIDMFTSDVVGLIGDPFEFTIPTEFTEAKLTFVIDKTKLKDINLDELLFLWYDEENQNFVELETIIDEENSSISTITDHFSQYMLVDSKVWNRLWENNPYIDMGFNNLPYQPNNIGIAKELPTSKKEALALSKSLGNSNYLLVETSPLDWKQAQLYCESYGGQLVTITSKEENDFVFNLTNQGQKLEYWIGGVWEANEQPTWITGEAFSTLQSLVDNWGSGLAGNLVISKYYPNQWAKGRITRPIEDYTQGISFVCEWNKDIVLQDTDKDGLADAYETKGMILGNGQVITTNPYMADTDGDELKDGEEISPEIYHSQLRTLSFYNYNDSISLEVNNKYYFKKSSNPNKKDSDGDKDLDAVDPHPLKYKLNGRFAYNIGKLENMARIYSMVNIDLLNKYNVDKEKWLVCMFIRQFNGNTYNNTNWSIAGGDIDDGFVQYVRDKNTELYEYFKDKETIYAGDNGELVDLYHWAATSTVLMYETDIYDSKYSEYADLLEGDWKVFFGNVIKNGKNVAQTQMFEGVLDDLGGWAGDLQTLMNDTFDEVGKRSDYDTFYKAMYNLLETNNSSFSKGDLLADVDAYNIHKMIKYKSFKDAILRYYNKDNKKRYKKFTNNQSAISLKIPARFYTDDKFMYMTIGWPLIREPLTDEQSDAGAAAYVDYLINLRRKE